MFTNSSYKRMGHKLTTKCTFCDEEYQSLVHLYIKCPAVAEFRASLSRNWPGEAMDAKRWFLGSNTTYETLEKSKNIIAKEANHFIFKMNWANSQLSVEAFKNWLKSEEEPEEALSQRINRVFDHQAKWSYIQLLLNWFLHYSQKGRKHSHTTRGTPQLKNTMHVAVCILVSPCMRWNWRYSVKSVVICMNALDVRCKGWEIKHF